MLKVMAADKAQQRHAASLAAQLQLPLAEGELASSVATDLFLWVSVTGLGLQLGGVTRPAPLYVDFINGPVGYRQLRITPRNELVARAVGVSAKYSPAVLDATAGFGRDAFVLASLKCKVTLLEKHPVVALVLADGMRRGRAEGGEAAKVLARMKLWQTDALAHLEALPSDARPDVIYLDPMFPQRKKAAKVKKEMQILQQLAGYECAEKALLSCSRRAALRRVVVKRPRNAPHFAGIMPSYSLSGSTSRFDIYT